MAFGGQLLLAIAVVISSPLSALSRPPSYDSAASSGCASGYALAAGAENATPGELVEYCAKPLVVRQALPVPAIPLPPIPSIAPASLPIPLTLPAPSAMTSPLSLPTSLLPPPPPVSSLLPAFPPESSLLPTLPPASSLLPALPPVSALSISLPPASDVLPSLPPASDLLPSLPPASDLLPSLPSANDLLPSLTLPSLPPLSSLVPSLPPLNSIVPSISLPPLGSILSELPSVPAGLLPSLPSLSPPPLPSITTSGNSTDNTNVAAIAGGTVGGLSALLLLLAGVTYWVIRRHRRNEVQNELLVSQIDVAEVGGAQEIEAPRNAMPYIQESTMREPWLDMQAVSHAAIGRYSPRDPYRRDAMYHPASEGSDHGP
ncbi:hypothetical protein NM688_g6980 [Phlebia brevispora]|uniref:Uncharacterized protein n=1 Tax=Phlebia brevispora TaxID=194682 RepID=A0ACC1SAA8_9APHY|nr:hypothetical protein NM688_g6980 [Phlebia brevispora]